MNNLLKKTLLPLLIFGLGAYLPLSAQAEHHAETTTAALLKAIGGDHRGAANQARDEYRDPLETLSFFGIEPGMTVVELWPGGGWYTEILAPYLRASGTLIAASYGMDTSPAYRPRLHKALVDKVAANPAVYGSVKIIEWDPPRKTQLGAAGTADAVLTFRNTHSFINAEIADTVFAEAFRVLKPGGVLGIVQHRAAPGTAVAESSRSGYVSEQAVIALAQAAGFVAEARSEINANPKDTRDHPEGVWTLPPSLRLGEVDADRYRAIGESDRMTLRFRKPQS